jgi:annexin A7/11
MALSGARDENPYVNHQQVEQDVDTLYRAGPGKIGTVSATASPLL